MIRIEEDEFKNLQTKNTRVRRKPSGDVVLYTQYGEFVRFSRKQEENGNGTWVRLWIDRRGAATKYMKEAWENPSIDARARLEYCMWDFLRDAGMKGFQR